MFLIIVSLLLGFVGMFIGNAFNLGGPLGIVGFFSPSLFLLQKTYLKLEELEEKSK